MFWKNVGKALAGVAKAAAKGALWASQHPEVVESIATIAGHPEVAAVIAQGAPEAQAIGAAIEQKVEGGAK